MSKLAILFIGLAIGLGLGHIVNQQAFKQASAEVYAECQRSRTSADVTENKCAELQSKYKIEFLCESRNNLLSNHCWTEENLNLE